MPAPDTEAFTFYGTIDTDTPANNVGGGGFPFVLDKVNVKDDVGDGTGVEYDYWTTLGGFNKLSGGTPTQEEIGDSWINACKLFWKAYGTTATYNGTAYTIDVDNDMRSGYVGNEEPVDRRTEASSGYGIVAETTGFDPLRHQLIVTEDDIFRMYDGDTSDESNFIGYGVQAGVVSAETALLSGGDLYIEVGSFRNLSNGDSDNYAYTTLSGIPVLCAAYGLSASSNVVPDPDNLTITGDNTDGDTITVSLDSLDFYDTFT